MDKDRLTPPCIANSIRTNACEHWTGEGCPVTEISNAITSADRLITYVSAPSGTIYEMTLDVSGPSAHKILLQATEKKQMNVFGCKSFPVDTSRE